MDFNIGQNAPVFKACISVAHDEELCRTGFRQLAVAGVDVHRFDDAMGSEVKIIAEDLEGIIFRHA